MMEGAQEGSGVTPFQHPMDVEDFRRNAHQMVDWIADYMQSMKDSKHPVLSQVQPGYLKQALPTTPPEEGEAFEDIMKDVSTHIVPGVTHWQHPSFFAFFSSNFSAPAFLGDMLSGTFNVVGFNWLCSPACTELETITMDWLADLLGLPSFFKSEGTGGGIIQGTASEAAVVAILGAKSRTWQQKLASKEYQPSDEQQAAFASKLVAYTSDQAHSAIKKGCRVAGIAHCRALPANRQTQQLEAETLKKAVQADLDKGLIPFFVTVTLGTTGTTAFDRLDEIGPVCEEFNLWLHVDAAFAGAAFVCPEYRHYLKGIEYAYSFDFNPHKWLLTNFDCSAFWVKERAHLINALSTSLEILRNKESESGFVIDYKDWQIPLGRRFRSLKLWFVIRSYGSKGLQRYIRHHVELAQLFESLVAGDERFEVTHPRTMSLVCFRLKSSAEDNKALEEMLNKSGKTYLSHTIVNDVYILRLAICGYHTEEKHVRDCWALISEFADTLLKQKS